MSETVLLVGDIHGEAGWVKCVCRIAKKYEVDHILQLGDFGFWPHYPQGERFLADTVHLLEHNDLHMHWIDGNHENHDVLVNKKHVGGVWTLGDRLHHLERGHRWEWGGKKFLACGGAYSIDKHRRIEGESWWDGETITEADLLRCGTDPVDILATHDAPWGAPNVIGPNTAGDKDSFPVSAANRQRVAALCDAVRPRLLVHGHYHHRNTAMYQSTRVEGFDMGMREGRGGGGYDSFGVLNLGTLKIERVRP